jgi:hypothetical protein
MTMCVQEEERLRGEINHAVHFTSHKADESARKRKGV